MKKLTVLIIDESKQPCADVSAYNADTAHIVITARTLQEGVELAEQSEEAALEACRNWKPAKAAPCAPCADLTGSKEAAAVKKAQDFAKTRKAKLTVNEIKYCAALAVTDKFEGFSAMHDLGYMRGFNAGRRQHQ